MLPDFAGYRCFVGSWLIVGTHASGGREVLDSTPFRMFHHNPIRTSSKYIVMQAMVTIGLNFSIMRPTKQTILFLCQETLTCHMRH